jgi:hypothetical protein
MTFVYDSHHQEHTLHEIKQVQSQAQNPITRFSQKLPMSASLILSPIELSNDELIKLLLFISGQQLFLVLSLCLGMHRKFRV